jgi:hypothetical protein
MDGFGGNIGLVINNEKMRKKIIKRRVMRIGA